MDWLDATTVLGFIALGAVATVFLSLHRQDACIAAEQRAAGSSSLEPVSLEQVAAAGASSSFLMF